MTDPTKVIEPKGVVNDPNSTFPPIKGEQDALPLSDLASGVANDPNETAPDSYDSRARAAANAMKGKKAKQGEDLRGAFMRATGYKKSDIIGHSPERRTFVTSSGGKYVLDPDGTTVHRLMGPMLPNGVDPDAEEKRAAAEAAENASADRG